MEIRLYSLLSGARKAEGTAIVIDVYRAFTTAAVAFNRGATQILLTAEVDEALALKERGLGDLCMGEVDGCRPAGFDFGNSPYELSQAKLTDKRLIQSTRAGTVGAAAASQADALYVTSLVNARATAAAVRRQQPALVTVVAMGREGRNRTDEDEQCALYIRNLLEGRRPDPQAVRALVLAGGESLKFADDRRPQFHPRDRDIALEVDSIDIPIRVERKDGLLLAQPAV